TRSKRDWSSDVCSSDLRAAAGILPAGECQFAISGGLFHARLWNGAKWAGARVGGGAQRHAGREPSRGRAHAEILLGHRRREMPRSEERRVGKEWKERWT